VSQRASGYERRPNEDYPTPAWVTAAIAGYLRRYAVHLWEPAAGNGDLAKALASNGFKVTATVDDFLKRAKPPRFVEAIVTNPPYGEDRRSALACDFIRHALKLDVQTVAMLLRVDFDSGKTRVDLFRDCPAFTGKIVLLDRIKWFEGPSQPSDNHAWFVWNRDRRGPPWITYAERPE
jgi:predicted RNA methylase